MWVMKSLSAVAARVDKLSSHKFLYKEEQQITATTAGNYYSYTRTYIDYSLYILYIESRDKQTWPFFQGASISGQLFRLSLLVKTLQQLQRDRERKRARQIATNFYSVVGFFVFDTQTVKCRGRGKPSTVYLGEVWGSTFDWNSLATTKTMSWKN